MQTDRRSFILAGAAFAASATSASAKSAALPPPGEARLRIGVISDIHVTTPASTDTFRAALRHFDSRKADGVLVCGDLADYGLASELQAVADAWFAVFPEGRRSDGEKIANLMHYGDHDMSRICMRRKDYAERKAQYDAETIPLNGPGEIWERCFHEKWSPIMVREVKGYTFVLGNHQFGNKANRGGDVVVGVGETLAKLRLDPKKPFFYSQHRILRNTAGGPTVWGQEAGVVGKELERYPNCVAFCGHGHVMCNDDRNLWQGAYTAIEVPSLRYLIQHSGRENGYSLNDKGVDVWNMGGKLSPAPQMMPMFNACRQGYFMTVYDDRLVIERLDFVHGAEKLADDWIVPLLCMGAEPQTFARRAAACAAPRFASGAKVEVVGVSGKDRWGTATEQFVVKFPPALSTAETPRAMDYEVTAVIVKGEVRRIAAQKRVYSPNVYLGEAREKAPVSCVFARDEICNNRDALFFEVRPLNVWGRPGEALVSERT